MQNGRSLNLLISIVLFAAGTPGCKKQQVYQSGAPGKSIMAGWEEFQMGEYASAIDTFSAAKNSTPEDDPNHLQAIYGLGVTWNLRRPGQDNAKAREYYEEILRLAPNDDLAAWSLLRLARLKHLVGMGEVPDYPAVREAYQRVIDQFVFHPAGETAFLFAQATFITRMDRDETMAAEYNLRQFLKTHAETPFLRTALSLLADCYLTLDRPRDQLNVEIQAIESLGKNLSSQNTPWLNSAPAYWRIATVAQYRLGDIRTARKYYDKLVTEYPRDQRSFGAELAIKDIDAMVEEARSKLPPASSGGSDNGKTQ